MVAHTGEKTHTCSECKKSFGRAGHLKTHMITYTGEKVHKCAQCGNSFGEIGDLKRRIHSGEKPHKCTQCDYVSALASTLKDHIKTHSLEKPNQCIGANSLQSQNHILPDICSPTAGRSHITVKSAEARSVKQSF